MPKYRRGDGSIYRRGKTWWLAYYVNGRRVLESANTKVRAEAREQLKKKMGKIAEGRLVVGADKVTFEQMAEDFLTDYRVNGRQSIGNARRRVEKHLARIFAGRRAHEITTADVRTFVALRQDEEASNGEINRELACLKRMFNLALQAGRISHKPHIEMLEEKNVRQGFFEEHQYRAVLAQLPPWLRPPVAFAYLTGWRIKSEIFPLQWANVDLDAGTVRLDPGTTKNKDGRLIYLTDEMQALLAAQWTEHETLHPDCPYVFHRRGGLIRYHYVSWRTACEKANLAGSIPHDFRRTAVRNMVRAGIPERVAMQMAGHKTRAVFDRYHIVADGDLREAAKRLNEALRPRTATVLATVEAPVGEEKSLTH